MNTDHNQITHEPSHPGQVNPSQWHHHIVKEQYVNPFKPDMIDFAFAMIAFVLGYLFSRWVFASWRGWGVSVFTTIYLASVSGYLFKKKVLLINPATIFWLAVTWLIGMSYALWSNAGFAGIRSLFLFCSAVYFVIIATGSTLKAKSGNYLLIDGIRATMIIPFRNFLNQYVSFSALARGKRRGKVLPVIFGIVVAVIMAAIIIPLLETADAGGFGMVLEFFRMSYDVDFGEIIFYMVLAIPVAAYLYGLISGAAHKKGTDVIKPESAEKVVTSMRIVPSLSINIVLGAVSVLYLVFIFSQVPYFFSAFTGVRPDGWLYYSEFARHGFFELCWIAAINLALLTAANISSKKFRLESKTLLKLFNVILAAITLVLIATAFSKMALYISTFGLTMPRLLPCIFMVFMAIVFMALIALQKWNFSIVKCALAVGTIMIVALCLSNPDAMVVRYNANRYMSGTLHEFDVEIVWRSRTAGVLAATEVYEWTQDENLRNDLRRYISAHSFEAGRSHMLSLESIRAQEVARSSGFTAPVPPSR
ncbi:MAG: DUF4173 domain-containing protein [Oscillospiraceae bacterium]|nr:DUF4173 domain-containing protein [Oscillospiraceae bacterium]